MNWDALDLSILAPAFCAGCLVLLTHVPLGIQVLARGIIFIDLAIAQIAGLGVIAASYFGHEPAGWVVQLSALGMALAGAAALSVTERRWPEAQEAIIGMSFVLAASAGVLLLAGDAHGGERLRELLVGQILWVGWPQLGLAAGVTAGVGALMLLLRDRHPIFRFYAVFALAVTLSVQLVGVYLVFASLIVPALATRSANAARLPIAYGLGAAGYAAGLTGSALFDLPSGALIVWCMAAIGCIVAALSPKRRARS